mgnify:CR=1 FL=1
MSSYLVLGGHWLKRVTVLDRVTVMYFTRSSYISVYFCRYCEKCWIPRYSASPTSMVLNSLSLCSRYIWFLCTTHLLLFRRCCLWRHPIASLFNLFFTTCLGYLIQSSASPEYVNGGIFSEVKPSRVMEFAPLRESLVNPKVCCVTSHIVCIYDSGRNL